jgi:cell division protein ZapA (FtsZ GTPase activity inhibitor)
MDLPAIPMPSAIMTTETLESDSQASISPPILDPMNNTAESANFLDSPQSPGPKQQAAFVSKLYQMVSDPTSDHLIKWTPLGDSFLVLRPEDFAKGLCSLFFKHNNWQSFVRQLNMYQFHKVNDVFHSNSSAAGTPTAWEFKHALFKRGRIELLAGIKRKASKPASQRDSYNSQTLREPYRAYQNSPVEEPNMQDHTNMAAGLLQHVNQRIGPIEESQRMLMNQSLALMSALNSYQTILQGMANVLASAHPSQSTQAIQQDIYALSQQLQQAQYPQRPPVSSHSSYARTASSPHTQPQWLASPAPHPASPSSVPIATPDDFTPAASQVEADSYFRVPLHNTSSHAASRPLTPSATGQSPSNQSRPSLQVHSLHTAGPQVLTPPLSDTSSSRTSSTSNVRESFAREHHLPPMKHHLRLYDQTPPPTSSPVGPTSNASQRPGLDRGRSLQSLLNSGSISGHDVHPSDPDHEDRKRRRTSPKPENSEMRA